MEWRVSDYHEIYSRRRQAPNSSVVESRLLPARERVFAQPEEGFSAIRSIRSSMASNSSAMYSSSMNRSVVWNHKFITFAILIVLLIASTSIVRADQGPPRADPALLQLAAEHPDDTFMVIIQREVKNKDLKDDDPETAVEKAGGKVKKQLQMIESFSAELTGKEIEKLAKHPKVRWISFDAPLVSTAVLAAVGTVYTVTNTNNSGAGSLRQAITDANGHAGADTIQFQHPADRRQPRLLPEQQRRRHLRRAGDDHAGGRGDHGFRSRLSGGHRTLLVSHYLEWHRSERDAGCHHRRQHAAGL